MQAQNPGNSGNQSSGQGSNQNGSNKPTLSWSQPSSNQAKTSTTSTSTTSTKTSGPANTSGDRSSMSAYIGVFVAGLVVGILVGWGITGLRGSSNTATATNASSTSATTTQTSTGSDMDLSGATLGSATTNSSSAATEANTTLTVASPQPAGSSVSVSGVVVSKPTWVAIYTDVSGKQGSVLGAQMFFPTSQGGKTDGTIALLRPTVAGQTYLVGELVDNGAHTFSSKTDQTVTINGSSVLAQFQAQ